MGAVLGSSPQYRRTSISDSHSISCEAASIYCIQVETEHFTVLSALVSTVWINGLRIVYFHEVVGAASADPVRGLGGELREGDIQVLRPRHLHRKYLQPARNIKTGDW